jgi:hypothetical protein
MRYISVNEVFGTAFNIIMEQTQMDFGTYARFYTMQEASALLLLLESNNIPYEIRQEVNQIDAVIIGQSLDPMIVVSVPATHFSEVNQLVTSSIDGITQDDSPADKDEQEEDSINEAKQEHLDWQWLLLGYLFSLFAIVGIFIGITLITTRKRLKNGDRIKMYDEATIMHGRIMFLLGVITTLWFIYRKFISLFVEN